VGYRVVWPEHVKLSSLVVVNWVVVATVFRKDLDSTYGVARRGRVAH